MYKWISNRAQRAQKMGQWEHSIFLYSIISGLFTPNISIRFKSDFMWKYLKFLSQILQVSVWHRYRLALSKKATDPIDSDQIANPICVKSCTDPRIFSLDFFEKSSRFSTKLYDYSCRNLLKIAHSGVSSIKIHFQIWKIFQISSINILDFFGNLSKSVQHPYGFSSSYKSKDTPWSH